MKFHGVQMVGPFVNQKMSALPTFEPSRDQARFVWLSDGTLWYGDDEKWVQIGSGGGTGNADETEDMYSDLLRTTIFLNASYDDFINTSLIDNNLGMILNEDNGWYEYTTGDVLESVNLIDPVLSINPIEYVLVSMDYTWNDSNSVLKVTSNGTDWFEVENNKIFRIPTENAGHNLKLRFEALQTGILFSWGVLYNKDLTASCTKWGLTFSNYVATAGQTTFPFLYYKDGVEVFVNGDLIDINDYDATSQTEIVFNTPLNAGDKVYFMTYSTSILGTGTGSPSGDDYIKSDGSVLFVNNQSMNNYNLTNVANAIDPGDAVNLNQLSTYVPDPVIYKSINDTVEFIPDLCYYNGVGIGKPVDPYWTNYLNVTVPYNTRARAVTINTRLFLGTEGNDVNDNQKDDLAARIVFYPDATNLPPLTTGGNPGVPDGTVTYPNIDYDGIVLDWGATNGFYISGEAISYTLSINMTTYFVIPAYTTIDNCNFQFQIADVSLSNNSRYDINKGHSTFDGLNYQPYVSKIEVILM